MIVLEHLPRTRAFVNDLTKNSAESVGLGLLVLWFISAAATLYFKDLDYFGYFTLGLVGGLLACGGIGVIFEYFRDLGRPQQTRPPYAPKKKGTKTYVK